MKKGELLDLNIEGYGFEGKGIAKVELESMPDKKFTIFVTGSYPGDKVRARIIKKKKSYAVARIEELLTAAPERTEPVCKHFNSCGGCKQQDLKYEVQIKYKHQQVKELFEHLGGLENFEIEPIVAADDKLYYRNKMEFSFSDKRWLTKEEADSEEEIKDRDFALGMHVPKIFDKVLDLHECYLQSEVSAKIVNFSRDYFRSNEVPAYSIKNHTGYLRNLVIRGSHHTNDLMVNLVTGSDDPEIMEAYTKALLREFPEITTVVNNVNLRKAQVAVGDFEKIYHGDGVIFDEIGEFKFRISPNSFFQTNTLQAYKLYSATMEYAEFKPGDIVYDLYSGAGTISIFMSSFVKKVYAMENVDAAVTDAGENVKINDINNVEFIQADLNKSFLPIVEANNLPAPDVIVADPPRSGMNPKTVKDILKLAPRRVVYVSCNPATQARDIQALTEGGYELQKIKPVDMFPQTYHIENVALLIKK